MRTPHAGDEYSGDGPLESGPASEARLDPDSIGSVVTYGAASLPSFNVTGSDRQVYTQVGLMQTAAVLASPRPRVAYSSRLLGGLSVPCLQ